ncbi:MAG: bacterioferritin [Candidatus Portiera sp.]|nr:bacterioferritin [Portiera sp.]
MKGNNEVIILLNEALGSELQAINQYMLHSSILGNLGHPKLAAFVKKQAIDEMHHAEKLIERTLFLDGEPVLMGGKRTELDKEPEAILKKQLALEKEAVELYRRAAGQSHQSRDYVTRTLFEELLADEENHYDWLDTQLGLIKRLGFTNYEAALITIE